MKKLYHFGFLVLVLLVSQACETDDLKPSFEAVLDQNLVMQKDTASAFEEELINVLTEDGFIVDTSRTTVADFIYIEFKDRSNELVFVPGFGLSGYSDMEFYLSSDPSLSVNDERLSISSPFSQDTIVASSVRVQPYLISYRSSSRTVFSVDQFNLE